jgi:hypothetical protein
MDIAANFLDALQGQHVSVRVMVPGGILDVQTVLSLDGQLRRRSDHVFAIGDVATIDTNALMNVTPASGYITARPCDHVTVIVQG